MSHRIHIPSYEEMVADQERIRREGMRAETHYIEVNKGSKKNPKWVRHSEYPCRFLAEQAMFRETMDIPYERKRVANADQSVTVITAIYPGDSKEGDEDD